MWIVLTTVLLFKYEITRNVNSFDYSASFKYEITRNVNSFDYSASFKYENTRNVNIFDYSASLKTWQSWQWILLLKTDKISYYWMKLKKSYFIIDRKKAAQLVWKWNLLFSKIYETWTFSSIFYNA